MMSTFLCFFFVFGFIGNLVTQCIHAADGTVDKSGTILHASSGHARSHPVVKASGNGDDLSAYDLSQDDASKVHLAGLDIHDESRKLSAKMHHLSNDELRVAFIQVHFSRKIVYA